MLRLLLQELRFRLGGIIGWSIGLALLPAMYVSVYPQIAGELSGLQDIMDLGIYQALGMSFGTFEEWVASTVINVVPIVLAIYVILDATGTLAGEEDDGRLELIVALPIPRWQIIGVKALAHGIALFIILVLVSLASTLVFLSIESQVETIITAGDLFVGLLYAWPLVMALGMIALFLGTVTPSRRLAALLAAAVMVTSYFGNNLAAQVSSLEAIQPLFLFYYYEFTAALFTDGPNTTGLITLLLIAAVAFLLAVFFFNRRDLTVGHWPWQRARAKAAAHATDEVLVSTR